MGDGHVMSPLDALGQAQLQPSRETNRQRRDDDAVDVSVPHRVVNGEERAGVAETSKAWKLTVPERVSLMWKWCRAAAGDVVR